VVREGLPRSFCVVLPDQKRMANVRIPLGNPGLSDQTDPLAIHQRGNGRQSWGRSGILSLRYVVTVIAGSPRAK
jgi:hypothetical protein